MHHDAVAADVDPTFFGIPCDHHVARADVAPAVALVPKGHGKFEEIDIVALKTFSSTGPDSTVTGGIDAGLANRSRQA